MPLIVFPLLPPDVPVVPEYNAPIPPVAFTPANEDVTPVAPALPPPPKAAPPAPTVAVYTSSYY